MLRPYTWNVQWEEYDDGVLILRGFCIGGRKLHLRELTSRLVGERSLPVIVFLDDVERDLR